MNITRYKLCWQRLFPFLSLRVLAELALKQRHTKPSLVPFRLPCVISPFGRACFGNSTNLPAYFAPIKFGLQLKITTGLFCSAAASNSTSDSNGNPSSASSSTSNTRDGGYESSTTEPQQVAEPAVNTPIPKKIVSIDTASIILDVNATGVIETEQDIDVYLAALKEKLTSLVNSNNKVRIR